MSHLSPNGIFSKFRSSKTQIVTIKPTQKACNTSRLLVSIAIASALQIQVLPPSAAAEDQQSLQSGKSENQSKSSKARDGSNRNRALLANVQSSAKKNNSQAKNKDGNSQTSQTSDAKSYFEQERLSRKRKYAHASSTVFIKAPKDDVWKVLIDFEHYPNIFKRIDTCHITKREHGLLFAETYLKPQMFVKTLVQHTVTDISQGPDYLQWKMLDGNFNSVVGSWTLKPAKDKEGNDICEAKYTLEADPGPIIPAPLVSLLLHQVEHEVVTSFKKACEKENKSGDDRLFEKKNS